MFKVYNLLIYHLYIILCVYHSKSCLLLSPFNPLYTLLSLPTLYLFRNHHTVFIHTWPALVHIFTSSLSWLHDSLTPVIQPTIHFPHSGKTVSSLNQTDQSLTSLKSCKYKTLFGHVKLWNCCRKPYGSS